MRHKVIHGHPQFLKNETHRGCFQMKLFFDVREFVLDVTKSERGMEEYNDNRQEDSKAEDKYRGDQGHDEVGQAHHTQ